MKYLKFLRTYVCLLLGFAALTACTSDEEEALIPEGKGYVKLSLDADTGFQTKAVDESEYTKLDNYTVQILKDGKVVDGMEWNYTNILQSKVLLAAYYPHKAFDIQNPSPENIPVPPEAGSLLPIGIRESRNPNSLPTKSFLCTFHRS